jgi:hypothetical protein
MGVHILQCAHGNELNMMHVVAWDTFACIARWKSFEVYHQGQKGFSPYYNPFSPYILIPIKSNESKSVKY